jgi:hypothetical protein
VGKIICDEIAFLDVFKQLNLCVQNGIGIYGYFNLSLGKILTRFLDLGYLLEQKTKINLTNYLDEDVVSPLMKQCI